MKSTVSEDKQLSYSIQNREEKDRCNTFDWNEVDATRYLLSSAVLWTLQDGSVYPFDLVKARLQVQGALPYVNFRYRNTLDSFKQMIHQEGVTSFWKGFGTQTAGTIPTRVIYYTCYEIVSQQLNKIAKKTNFDNSYTEFTNDCLAGGAAELVSACIWIPFDIVVQRLQIQGPLLKGQSPRYTGPIDAVRKILQYEGLEGLFRGYGPTLATFIPYGAVSFGVYQLTKKHINSVSNDGSLVVNVISGFIAGVVAATVTNPMDVAKTRIQTQEIITIKKFMHENNKKSLLFPQYPEIRPKYTGAFSTILLIMKEEGWRALGKGLTARICGGAPAAALSFGIYEIIKMVSLKTTY